MIYSYVFGTKPKHTTKGTRREKKKIWGRNLVNLQRFSSQVLKITNMIFQNKKLVQKRIGVYAKKVVYLATIYNS
jgi:hypothetical protein